MEKTKYILFFILIATSCETSDLAPYTYSNETTIYSENEQVVLRELIVILKPYIIIENQKKYILSDSLFNIDIYINGNSWGKYNSLKVDTSLFEKSQINDYLVTDDEVKYSIIASLEPEEDTITTAGGYSALLNNRFTLQPGFYICEIKSFEIHLINNKAMMIKTSITEAIEVKENQRSTLIGEIEIKIN